MAWAWARVTENIRAWASTRKVATMAWATMAWATNTITGTTVVSVGNTAQFTLALPKLA